MKKIIIATSIISIAFASNAQQWAYSLGLYAPQIAIQKNRSTFAIGAGGSLQTDYWVNNKFAICAEAGYISFTVLDFGKKAVMPPPGTASTKQARQNFTMIPLLAGVKYNLLPRLYIQGQMGYSLLKGISKTSLTVIKNTDGTTTSSSILTTIDGAFTYAPAIGYQFSKHFDISMKMIGLAFVYDKKGATENNGIVTQKTEYSNVGNKCYGLKFDYTF